MLPLAVVQARMDSTRLPGKVLAPLGKGTVLDAVVERIRLAAPAAPILVAIPTDPASDPIAAWAASRGIGCVRGPRDDVLARFIACLDRSPAEWLIRITADCPLLDPALLLELARHRDAGLDHVAFVPGALPLGLTGELARAAALRELDRTTRDPAEREHVTLGLYRARGGARTLRLAPPADHPLAGYRARLTLDEPRDYEVITRLVGALGTGADMVRIRAYLDRNPEVAALNLAVEQRIPTG